MRRYRKGRLARYPFYPSYERSKAKTSGNRDKRGEEYLKSLEWLRQAHHLGEYGFRERDSRGVKERFRGRPLSSQTDIDNSGCELANIVSSMGNRVETREIILCLRSDQCCVVLRS